jgi:2-amino-4-hydroxy-6-hydroxymethyldihydropteridine diphosphokinase
METGGEGVSETVCLGLGSNLGNREANLRLALRYVSSLMRIDAVSSLYETKPVGGEEQPNYFNAVCRLTCGLSPEALVDYLKRIEFEIGRRPAERWSARPIDLDVLLIGERAVETERLVVPHPRLAERAFVLVPLAEIAPEARHPFLRKKASELLASLERGELAGVRKIKPQGWEAET